MMPAISPSFRVLTVMLVATAAFSPKLASAQRNVTGLENEPSLSVRFKLGRNEPLSPHESLRNLVPAEGFRVELVASEPQVIDPVCARFDSHGRLWVVEMRDYPFVPEGAEPQGQIRVLEDQDDDGYFEVATTFVTGLNDPTGLAFFRDGIIVTLAGKIVFFPDANEDLRSDKEEVWFEGFMKENEQLRANHPTWLLDGRLHIASGLRGGEIRSMQSQWPSRDAPVGLAGRDFEFSPWSSHWGSAEGNSQFGFWQDSAGNMYACSNRNPCRLLLATPEQAARNPLLPLSVWTFDVMPAAENSRVFSLVDTFTTSHLHTGQFTAACAVYRYENSLLGPNIFGSFFACEPTASIIQQAILVDNVIPKETRRPDPNKEFLASHDSWFRPVDLFDGPDGAIYVVDMHRAIIEHPDWVPPQWKETINNRSGDQAGRIYRIVPDQAVTPSGQLPSSIADASDEELLNYLGSSNRWLQETAMRLLVERVSGARPRSNTIQIAEQLQELLVASAPAPLWIRGIGLLDALTEITIESNDRPILQIREQILRKAFDHPLDEVRLQVVQRIAPDQLFREAVRDRSPHVRYAWILHASEYLTADDADYLSELVLSSTSDDIRNRQWIGRGISLVDAALAPPLLRILSQRVESKPGSECLSSEAIELLEPLLEKLGWQGHADTLGALMANHSESGLRLRQAYLQGAARRGLTFTKLAANLSDTDKQTLQSFLRDSADEVNNTARRSETRLSALQLLAIDDTGLCESTLRTLLRTEQSDFLLDAWEKLLPKSTPQDAQVLVSRLDSVSPRLAVKFLESLATRPDSSEILVSTIEETPALRGFLSPSAWERLKRHPQEPLHSRVKALWNSSNETDKSTIVARYLKALKNETSAAHREEGVAVFRKNCASCHRIDGHGHAVGPDISDMRTQTPEQIVQAILAPNAAIDANYFRYQVITTSGQLIEGLLLDQYQGGVTLRLQDSKTAFVPREEIEQSRTSPLSMMPEGFEQSISTAEMFQLVDYLKNWRFESP